MSTSIENSGVIQATIGAGYFGYPHPATLSVGTTPVALFANNVAITGSSASPVFPTTASYTAVESGTYRFRYYIYVSASRSSSTSSATATLYLQYKIVRQDGTETTDDITNISASVSSGTSGSSSAKNAKYASIDLELNAGDVVYFGGYKTGGTSSYTSSTATIYSVVACIDWDNGF